MHQPTDPNASSFYQYYQDSTAVPPLFASAPPVSSTDHASAYPSSSSNPDHSPIPPQSSIPYSFPHLHHSSSDDHNLYPQNPNTPLNYDYATSTNPNTPLNYDHAMSTNRNTPLNYDYAMSTNPNPNPNYSPSLFSYSYSDGTSAFPYHADTFGNNVSYGEEGLYDGGVYKYNGRQVELKGGGSSDAGSGDGVMFDDYGRPINNYSKGKEIGGSGYSSPKIVKAVPKAEDFQDVKSGGVQKFRVKLLSEGFGQTDMDVLCQIGLDGIQIHDPATNRALKIYPLDTVTRWEVLDSYIFAFWANTNVDPEPRRIRLKSSTYTTNNILDTVTAASIQSKEIGASSTPSGLVKGPEQSVEKKKGIIDWKNLMRPANEEKDHWVPDEAATKCTACGTDFNAFNRKHHCRNCGDIFCDKCTQGRIALTTDDSALPVRVCDQCMAEVTQRLSNIKEAPARAAGFQSHVDLARKLQEEMDKNRKISTGIKSEATGTRMREVACPTCTVHLQVLVPASGSETIECSVCQNPFLVNAH